MLKYRFRRETGPGGGGSNSDTLRNPLESAHFEFSNCKLLLRFKSKMRPLPAVLEISTFQLNIEDNGSVSSRGNVLLTAYEMSGDKRLLVDVKLYHYGCVYNNWRDLLDEACFKLVIRTSLQTSCWNFFKRQQPE